MGNKSSSERRSRGSSKYSQSVKASSKDIEEMNKHRRQLVKSASCGTMMIMSPSNDQVFGRQPSEPNSTSSISHTKDFQHSSPRSPSVVNNAPPNNNKTIAGLAGNNHHYNIHRPEQLLGFKTLFVNSNYNRSPNSAYENDSEGLEEGPSVVKRSQSALDFLASKSPLQGLIKGNKLGKGSSSDQLDSKSPSEQNNSTKDTHRNSLRPPLPPGKTVEGNPKKMECNLDKFAKLLAQNSGQKSGQISTDIFKKHVLPESEIVSKYMWRLFANYKDCNTISESYFVQIAEKIYTLITDKDQISFYLKVFGHGKDSVDRDFFVDFLIGCYELYAISNGEKLESWNQKDDFEGKEWIESVTKSCYHLKDEMSVCFLSNWLLTNLPRLMIQLHKYVLHQLTTGYTQLSSGNKTVNTSLLGISAVLDGNLNNAKDDNNDDETPSNNKTNEDYNDGSALSPVLIWLFRASLPVKFVSIFDKKVDQQVNQTKILSPSQLLQQLMNCRQPPEKWSLLYNSENDGLSINRFQFHVFNYRGPTILFVKADNGYTFAIASDCEWKESCHFWGGEDCMLVQLQPEFRIVERGAKIMYANFSIRGYSFGIQTGKDPRNVSLDIKPDFSYAHFKQIPCRVQKLFVYGCAPSQAKASQTDFKKWEAKQCENIRKVNISAAEWKDNPDKYLLELAGGYRSYDN